MGFATMRALFSFHGRTGRLAYLGIFAVQMMFLLVAIVLGGGALALGSQGSMAGGALGALVIMGGLVGMIWIGAAAMVRRARDMGWDPALTAGLWYGGSVASVIVPPLAIPVFLAQGVAGLFLIFKGPVPSEIPCEGERGDAPGDEPATDGDMDRALEAMLAARRAGRATGMAIEAAIEAATGAATTAARASPLPAPVRSGASGPGLSPARRGGFGRRGAPA